MTFSGPYDPADDRHACEACDGEGESCRTEDPCTTCRGRGWVRETERARLRAEDAADDPYLVALVGAHARSPSGSDEEGLIREALEQACARLDLDWSELVEAIEEGMED